MFLQEEVQGASWGFSSGANVVEVKVSSPICISCLPLHPLRGQCSRPSVFKAKKYVREMPPVKSWMMGCWGTEAAELW